MRILKIKTPESKLKTWIGGVPKGLAPVLLIIRIEKRLTALRVILAEADFFR